MLRTFASRAIASASVVTATLAARSHNAHASQDVSLLSAELGSVKSPSGLFSSIPGMCNVRFLSTTHAEGPEHVEPPIAERRPQTIFFGFVEGENRGPNPMNPPISHVDPYYWLRDDDRQAEDVIAYLAKENEYAQIKTAHLDHVREELYNEMLSHVKETDQSAPFFRHPNRRWEYYSRTEKGKSYRIHCRRDRKTKKEEVLLDENEKSAELRAAHFDVGAVQVAPSENLLAFTYDLSGNETYNCKIVNLTTGEVVDELKEIDGHLCFGKDDKTVFYATMDDAHRPYKVWMHKVGSSQDEDVLLREETDELFWTSFSKTRDGRFVVISHSSSTTAESWIVDVAADKPEATLVAEREQGVLYSLDTRGNNFWITTNEGGAKNFKLMRAPLADPKRENWSPIVDKAGRPVFPGSDDVTVSSAACFGSFVAVEGRQDGLPQVWIVTCKDTNVQDVHLIEFPEKAYDVGLGVNKLFDTEMVRLVYSSPVTPSTVYDYIAPLHILDKVKQTEVPNYDPSKYKVDRVFAESHDGTKVPITVFYSKKHHPKGLDSDGPKPLYLYGYGSYGICIDASFSSRVLPLVDRGVVYCIANIRGGSELGWFKWYEEQGKWLTKKNTFLDFIACAEHLIKLGWTKPDRIAIEGRSAGGLLMGAVINMRPELFKVVIAGVPFVDVLVSMRDATIPLTVGEWEEWGNPNEEKFFEYMKSYSPINNVQTANYPSILITAGLHDPRVAYWEPAKWCATLRQHKLNQEEEPLLLKTDLDSGHFSASDRYRYIRERSFDYAFVLDRLGLVNTHKK